MRATMSMNVQTGGPSGRESGQVMQLGVRDIARILGVSEKTIYRWIKQGAIPVYRVQDQYRIRQAELLEWVSKKRIQVSEEIFQEETVIPEQALSLRAALE